MKPSRFTEEQIIGILRGRKTADVCRKHGISSATFYKWKAKYGGLVSEAKRLTRRCRCRRGQRKRCGNGRREAATRSQKCFPTSLSRVVHMRVGRQWLQFRCAIFV
jgi:putative transposase